MLIGRKFLAPAAVLATLGLASHCAAATDERALDGNPGSLRMLAGLGGFVATRRCLARIA